MCSETNNIIVDNSYFFELNLPQVQAGSQYPFPDVPELRNKFTHGLDLWTSTQLSATPDGFSTPTPAMIADVLLVLSVGSKNRIYQIPGYRLVSSLNSGLRFQIAYMNINWQKSYVQLVGNLITPGFSIAMTSYYVDAKNIPSNFMKNGEPCNK